ncbi:hypothetical protein [Acidiphilium sp. C61]|uniref:hypothetical protein n=1 Tax=Acidiphilium sp. C61 TaxID=1671485 RepID=UPI00157B84D3|nr:hypothetical protein [Acidiphilium sp. C61]
MNRRSTIRAAMAGAAAAIAAPAVANAASNPDAALIALCDRFVAQERIYLSYFSGGANYIADDDERDAIIEPMQDAQGRLVDAIVQHRATTPAGLMAVARCFAEYCPDKENPADEMYPEQKLATMIARDVRGLA